MAPNFEENLKKIIKIFKLPNFFPGDSGHLWMAYVFCLIIKFPQNKNWKYNYY